MIDYYSPDMPTPLIRWQDPGLWPSARACVPDGHHVLTDRAEADDWFYTYLVFSARTRASRITFGRVWKTVMDSGFQPNGIVIASMGGVAEHLNISATPCRDFLRWVRDNDLWRQIPGKLHPSAQHLPGGRHRAYLVLGGTCDHCAVPRRPLRT